jgi:hypothetical protein
MGGGDEDAVVAEGASMLPMPPTIDTVDTSDTIAIIFGQGFWADGGPAFAARFDEPFGVAVDDEDGDEREPVSSREGTRPAAAGRHIGVGREPAQRRQRRVRSSTHLHQRKDSSLREPHRASSTRDDAAPPAGRLGGRRVVRLIHQYDDIQAAAIAAPVSRRSPRSRRSPAPSRPFADRSGDDFFVGDAGGCDDSGAGAEDSGQAGSFRTGDGTIFARNRLVDAKTPCRVDSAPPDGVARSSRSRSRAGTGERAFRAARRR